jgi:hypothetical protein
MAGYSAANNVDSAAILRHFDVWQKDFGFALVGSYIVWAATFITLLDGGLNALEVPFLPRPSRPASGSYSISAQGATKCFIRVPLCICLGNKFMGGRRSAC